MSILRRVKRILGVGGESDAKTEGADVTIHLEHPGLEGEEMGDVDEATLEEIKGIGPTYASRLEEAGIDGIASLAAADPEELAGTTGISETRLATWIDHAQARIEEQ